MFVRTTRSVSQGALRSCPSSISSAVIRSIISPVCGWMIWSWRPSVVATWPTSLRPSPPLAILTVRGLVVFLDLGSRHRGSGGVFLAPCLDEHVPPHPAQRQLKDLLAERPRQFISRRDDERVIVGVESSIVVQAFDQPPPRWIIFQHGQQALRVDH